MNKNPTLRLYENAHSKEFPGNFFSLPNEVFSLELDAVAIAIYAYLRCLENRKKRDRDRHTCYPSYKQIGDVVRCSKHTVSKYVAQLCEKRLIDIEQTQVTTKSGRKRNGHLKYHILPIKAAIQYRHERQVEREKLRQERERVAKLLEKQMPSASGFRARVNRTWEEANAQYISSRTSETETNDAPTLACAEPSYVEPSSAHVTEELPF